MILIVEDWHFTQHPGRSEEDIYDSFADIGVSLKEFKIEVLKKINELWIFLPTSRNGYWEKLGKKTPAKSSSALHHDDEPISKDLLISTLLKGASYIPYFEMDYKYYENLLEGKEIAFYSLLLSPVIIKFLANQPNLNGFIRIGKEFGTVELIKEPKRYLQFAEEIFLKGNVELKNEQEFFNPQNRLENFSIRFDITKEAVDKNYHHPYQFIKRENNKIKIVFDGKDIALRNEGLIGLHYLRLIIKYGINGISHKELENYYYQNGEESKEIKKINAENYYQGEEDEKKISLRTLEESITHKVVDEKTIRSVKREIDDLKEEAKILENELRIDEADELNLKIKKLSENMRKYKNKEGEIREFDEDFRKRKRRVKKAYNGAMEQIKEDNLEFYLYLAKTIDDKKDPNKYFFVPLNNVDWILD